MAPIRPTTKTWIQLTTAIKATFTKWPRHEFIEIESDFELLNAIGKRRAGKSGQTPAERTVTLVFSAHAVTYRLRAAHASNALDNLAHLAFTIEALRRIEAHGMGEAIATLFRQTHPDTQRYASILNTMQQATQRRQNAYDTLFVAQNAPLAICEAAYRTLAKVAHTDVGGSDAQMKMLNRAIEEIRNAQVVGVRR